MADFCDIPGDTQNRLLGLGNRCSVLLSYGGTPRFPSFAGLRRQCGTRGMREADRFVSAHAAAQFVRLPFQRVEA